MSSMPSRKVTDAIRELRLQLALLNVEVGSRLKLSSVELNCLEVIAHRGPLNPTALARLCRMHPATMTGVLDRLERGGWIKRERDTADRRAVLVQVVEERHAEVLKLYSGMNSAVDAICSSYSEKELAKIGDFLKRCAEAVDELHGARKR